MSCVSVKEQFLSYVDFNPHQSSYWNHPAFMKSCNDILSEVETLMVKFRELESSIISIIFSTHEKSPEE